MVIWKSTLKNKITPIELIIVVLSTADILVFFRYVHFKNHSIPLTFHYHRIYSQNCCIRSRSAEENVNFCSCLSAVPCKTILHIFSFRLKIRMLFYSVVFL